MPLPYKDFAKTKAKVTHCKTRLEPDLGVSCLKKLKKDSFYRVTKRVFRYFHSSLTCTHHVWCQNTCFSPWCALGEGRQSCHTSRPCWCHGNGTNHCTLQAQSQKSAEEKKKKWRRKRVRKVHGTIRLSRCSQNIFCKEQQMQSNKYSEVLFRNIKPIKHLWKHNALVGFSLWLR